MEIADFKIERYFAQWEFAVPFVLGASDIEGYRQSELLAMADDECCRLWDGLTLGYTESRGHPLLRAEIASLYERIDADDSDRLESGNHFRVGLGRRNLPDALDRLDGFMRRRLNTSPALARPR